MPARSTAAESTFWRINSHNPGTPKRFVFHERAPEKEAELEGKLSATFKRTNQMSLCVVVVVLW